MKSLSDYVQIKDNGEHMGFDLREVFTAAGEDLLELIWQCLRFDPLKRWNATQALQSRYFSTEPYACEDSALPIGGGGRKRKGLRDADGDPPASRRKLDFE